MSESGVIPRHEDRQRRMRFLGAVETDDGMLGVEVHGDVIRISGDIELAREQQEDFAVLFVRACWEAGHGAERGAL